MTKMTKMNKKRFTRKLKKGTSAKFTRSKKRSSSSQKKKGTLSNINYRSFGMAARMSRL